MNLKKKYAKSINIRQDDLININAEFRSSN